MAARHSINDDLFNELMADRAIGFGDDNQSDISISSGHTINLSDFESADFSSSDSDEIVPAEWSNTVVDTEPEAFTSVVGPKKPLGLDAKPIEYFFQLFPLGLVETIAQQTNLYAEQKGAVNFVPTCVKEIRAYLGMLFLMGVIQLPNYRCYWSKKPELRQPAIAEIMSRNRYEQLTKYFHMNDCTQNPPHISPGHDKLHKVRPILDNAKKQFASHYEPHKNLSVDEAIIKYKGRCSFLQYFPSKPTKWGIKAWVLADSESYYFVDFNIYVGKGAEAANNLPLGIRVVTDLVKKYYKKNHHVYFDKFFTSIDLLETLLANKTYGCGTVRLNRRGLPVSIKTCKLKSTGQMKKMQKGKLTAITWCEKKCQVSVLSTANRTGNITITRKGKGGAPDQTYPKPIAIQKYSEYYNGVDKNDQLRSYYGIANKAKKWWKYVFWFFLDVTVINAYILCRDAPGGPRPKPISHLDFHLEVAKGLINGYTSRKRKHPVDVTSPVIKKPAPHHLTKIESKRGHRNCVVCAKGPDRTPAGNKIQSSWECNNCQVALCKEKGCFGKFHNFQHEDRIRNGIKKLNKARQGSTQGRLDSFFKVTSVTTTKRKPEETKGSAKKKPKGNSSFKKAR